MSFKVGMVMMASRDDGTWGQSGYEGLLALQKRPGIETAIFHSLPASEWIPTFRRLASEGYDLILGHGGELSTSIRKVAEEYPNTLFACVNGLNTLPNLASFTFRDEQLGFLAGWLAARMSRTGCIAFVGGRELPSTRRQALGFLQAAGENDVKGQVEFLGSFDDGAKAHQVALNLAQAGADIFYYYLKTAEAGLLDACREMSLHAIGAIRDHIAHAPEVFYACTLQNPGRLHQIAGELALKGELQGRRYTVGLEDPLAQSISRLNNVPEVYASELNLVMSRIIAGEIDLSSLPLE